MATDVDNTEPVVFSDMTNSELSKDDLLYAYSFVHDCISAPNTETFHKKILDLSGFLGFEFVLYGYIQTIYTDRRDAVVINLTNPQAWMKEYFSHQENNPLIDEIERQYTSGSLVGYCVWDQYNWTLSEEQQQHIARRREFGLEYGCSIFVTSKKKDFSINLSLAGADTIPDARTEAIVRMVIYSMLITKKRLLVQDQIDSLTEKEKEVADKIAIGLPYKVIGQQIGVSENTIKFHLKNINNKLQTSNRHQVAAVLLAERYLS
ncbi:LuxR C-terminal-related transcriptional regulator [uncultured Desulfuromonas sp.]|uniref:LuxR C-terminal-related transcriptional regulator n=1 Tax=uncultured Desulfuromonas sp. TaxID=181013 RepID=UPI002AAC0541|nr:LuxR C-terminal-related transcriptional regulator [uncultured Desulfuromonas sp.]